MGEVRLALFTDTYAPEVNGVAKTLERWVRYLEKQGVACQVFAPSRPRKEGAGSDVAERLSSIPFFLYPECRLAMPVSVSAERKLLDFRPTVVHVATPFGTGMAGRRLALKLGIPLVASHHTHFVRYLPFYNLQWMGTLLWRYLHWFHRPCRRIYVPSGSVLEECRKDGWIGLDIWSRAIDPEVFHPRGDRHAVLAEAGWPDTCYPVLYAGRLAPEKRVDVAIEAMARFAKETGVDARLVLAGEGPQAAELRALAERHQVKTLFLGVVPQSRLQSWMAVSEAFLFPSPTETFGNVALEAMACGLPVIGANEGAVPDTVRDGETGLLCPSGDSAAFAAALNRLYRDPGMRGRLSERAHSEAGLRSWDDVFRRLLTGITEASAEASAV